MIHLRRTYRPIAGTMPGQYSYDSPGVERAARLTSPSSTSFASSKKGAQTNEIFMRNPILIHSTN